MKNTTRLLSLVLVVCMLLGMIPAVSASTAAAQTVTPEAVEPDYFTSTDWIWSSTSVSKNSVSYFRNDYELKAVPTALGLRREDRFLYLGPAELALTAGESRVYWNGQDYEVQSAHPVGGTKTHHWWAVLRPVDREGA